MANFNEDIALKITGDSSGAVSAIEKIDASLGGFNQAFQDLQDRLRAPEFTNLQVAAAALEHPLILLGGVIEGIGAQLKAFGDQGDSAFQKFQSAAGGALEGVPSKFSALWDDITAKGYNKIADFGELVGDRLTKVIEDPIGSLKGALIGTLEEMGPFGLGLAAIGGGAVAAGTAIFELAEKTAKYDEHILEMSEKIGATVEGTSRLSNALDVAGSSIDKAANVMFVFERNVGQGGATLDRVKEGLEKLGLSLDDLKQLAPDEQFLAIAHAAAGLSDPFERNAALSEIFNARLAKDLIPTFMKLDEAMEKTKDIAPLTPEQAAAAQELDLNVRSVEAHLKDLERTAGNLFIKPIDILVRWTTSGLDLLKGHGQEYDKDLVDLLKTHPEWSDKFEAMGLLPNRRDVALGASSSNQGTDEGSTSYGDQLKQAREQMGWLREFNQGGDITAALALKTSHQEIADSYGVDKAAVDLYVDSLKNAESATRKAHDAAISFTAEWQTAADRLGPILESSAWDGTTEGAIKLGASVKDLAVYYSSSKDQIAGFEGSIKADTQAMKDSETAWKATNKEIESNEKITTSAAAAIGKSLTAGGQNVLRDLAIATYVPASYDFMGPTEGPREGQGVQLGGAHPIKGLQSITGLEPDLTREGHSLAGAMATPLTAGFEGLFTNQVPNAILAAVEGGGSPFQAVGSMIGKQLGTNIGKDIGGHFASQGFGHLIGESLSSILPGIGAFVGPLIDKLFHIGGPSKEELEGRKVEGSFESQFANFGDMMKKIGDAYIAEGLGAQKAEADVKRLMDAEKQGGDAVKKVLTDINGVLNDQAKDAADTDAAIKKYNFTLAELGPTLQRQKLGEQAAAIERDFTLLTKAGIDVTVVEAHMGTAINEFVNQARKAGGEIPIEMKPVIQSMLDQGKLLDENGNKFTSLDATGLTFSETMTQGFDKIVKKFDELLRGLGLLPALAAKAAANVPKNPFSDWIVPGVTPPAYGVGGPEVPTGDEVPIAHSGAIVWAGGLQHLHEGGFPKLWGMQPDEVFAILKQGEAIMQPSAVQSLGPEVMRAVNTGSAAAVMSATLPRLPRSTGATRQADTTGATPGNVTIQVVVQADRRELAKGTLDSVFLGEHRAYFNELVKQALKR